MSPSVNSPQGSRATVLPVPSLSGTIKLPGSKSMTNRALVLAALASESSVLHNALDCDDSRYLIESLRVLGVEVESTPREGMETESTTVKVVGAGGPFPVKSGRFFIGNAGTTARFLTALLAACGGDYVVDGDARMRERPIEHLVRALLELGAEVSAPTGCPPVTIGLRPVQGGKVRVPGHVSSQFISALLMAAPLARKPVEIQVTGELVSRPYIDLTLHAMRDFGMAARADDGRADGHVAFRVPAGRSYLGREYHVEGDASAASYFYGAAALTGGSIRVEGVGKETPQGDAACADVLAAMGCRVKKEREAVTVTGPRLPKGVLKGVDHNCAEIPDVVPTLAVVALFASGRTRLRGVAHLRHKESDRIASVASELRKLGGQVKELPDGLEIEGTLGPAPSPLRGAAISTWGDHRIAMAFSLAGLVLPDVVLLDPKVVSKSFPGYFNALRSLGVTVRFE